MTRTYKLPSTTGGMIAAVENGVMLYFPPSPGNADYQRYLADGGDAIAQAADPPVVFASGGISMTGRVRTTTGAVTEIYRATLTPLTGYRALATLIGVDAGNGDLRQIYASIMAKRLGGAALLVGTPVVLASHSDPGASTWTMAATVAGNDFIITVSGAAGRTVDWLLSGQIVAFTPGGA